MTRVIDRLRLPLVATFAALSLLIGALVLTAPSLAQEVPLPPVEQVLEQPATPTLDAPAAAPAASEVKEEPSFSIDFYGFVRSWLGDVLTGVLALVLSAALTAMGFKEFNAAKLQDMMRDERMQPYTENVITLASDAVLRLWGKTPDDIRALDLGQRAAFIAEMVEWMKDQYPEVLAWIGKKVPTQKKYIDLALPSPKAVAALTGPLPRAAAPKKAATPAPKAKAPAAPKAPPAAPPANPPASA